ncbi:MAG: 4-hydroxy-3-methylbut-2-enyl diphosphate reductase [Candidatus Eremiobacteraeota bacterium]|jgi:4-hydroxy-3-methylbut-2-enyl diphosphate reductase|nr:4-hydroxy-3-methylbut-2-enyl diphosphate reductase [Candidatus Eremiobacteraeota bacterium]MCL5055241.1 4-hydroxy-3-methylbut-2-enyl diphosphate reductase [Bacillota bacterium]
MKDKRWPEKILLASPRGFCAGVDRAIDVLNRVQAADGGEQIYSYHQIVHNTHVVRKFEEQGVKFVEDISMVPQGKTVVFSAHGVSPEIRESTQKRELNWIDATCPLVEKPHREVKKFAEQGYTILYIGHAGHDETIGTMGEAPNHMILIETVEDAKNVQVPNPEKLALTTQTTLSLDDTAEIVAVLKARFPHLTAPRSEDVCYATQNRQDAVKAMVRKGAEAVVIVGSSNSSNAHRMREVAEQALKMKFLGETKKGSAYLIDDVQELDGKESFFSHLNVVGLSSAASVSEEKFQEVVNWFKERGSRIVEEEVVADESKIHFASPQRLRLLEQQSF